MGQVKPASAMGFSVDSLSKEDLVGIINVINASLSVGTEEQFQKLLLLASTVLPIEKAHVSVADLLPDLSISRTSRQVSVGFPSEWLRTYRDEALNSIDPVAKHLFVVERPLVWSQLRRSVKSNAAKAFYGAAADHGIKNGFSFGAKFSRSPSASFFSCIGDDLTHHPRHVAALTLLLPHLHAALLKVHLGMLKKDPGLTAREIEVLNWAKFGKTNWEISLQLNVSERAVKFHIENAIRKLQANNRSQAIAIALSQGLIDWG